MGKTKARLGNKVQEVRQRSLVRNQLAGGPLEIHDLAGCVRKIASCSTGLVVSVYMTAVMPHHLIAASISGAELAIKLYKLHKFEKEAGGMRRLFKLMSKRDIFLQVCTGVTIKSGMMSLTLGNGLDFAVEYWSEAVSGQVGEHPQSFIIHHERMLESPPPHATNGVANFLPEMIGERYPDVDTPPTWGQSGVQTKHILGLGVAEAASNKAVELVCEPPVHRAVDRACQPVSCSPQGGSQEGWK